MTAKRPLEAKGKACGGRAGETGGEKEGTWRKREKQGNRMRGHGGRAGETRGEKEGIWRKREKQGKMMRVHGGKRETRAERERVH